MVVVLCGCGGDDDDEVVVVVVVEMILMVGCSWWCGGVGRCRWPELGGWRQVAGNGWRRRRILRKEKECGG
ncbi:hypothetical protein Tco_1103059 [Tanacetum coccineum]